MLGQKAINNIYSTSTILFANRALERTLKVLGMIWGEMLC